MADYRSDEEQVELLQRWWRDNGTSLLISIAVVVAGVIGWRAWQDSRADAAMQAAALYANFTQALAADDAESRETARFVAEQLRAEHGDSGYALLAALQLARRALEDGDLVTAQAELRSVIDADATPTLTALARVRLARVLYEQDRLDDALAELARVDDPGLAVEAGELRGDILLAKGDVAGAEAAYAAALQAAGEPGSRPLLKQKLDALR